ncbi:MAG: hypothetical protein M0Z41_10475, partial [Peptococcaceae bacterium]|nr:hypothetical protein [Peptococcaceae bacterium]
MQHRYIEWEKAQPNEEAHRLVGGHSCGTAFPACRMRCSKQCQAAPCAILLIGYASGRRTMPGANYFILMSFTAIIYNGAYIYEINSNRFPQAIFWFNVVHFVIPLQQYLWLMMSLEYAGVRKRYLKLAKYGTLYHPVL